MNLFETNELLFLDKMVDALEETFLMNLKFSNHLDIFLGNFVTKDVLHFHDCRFLDVCSLVEENVCVS